MTRAELGAWIGADAAYSGVRLTPHDADAPAVGLGGASSGVVVEAHPAVARASGVLVLGRIVFHYLAGFGGGRKMLVPGVAARHTVIGVHAACLSPAPGAGRHPRAATGVLDGNPVHEAAIEAARLFPPAGAIHIQLTAAGALADASFGDIFGDHRRAAESYASAFRTVVDEPLDAVIVSAGGHPTDRDLVQAHKALEAVAPVVKDGGSVVLVAACPEGVGNLELRQGLGLGPAEAIEKDLRREFRVGVHTALALRIKTTRLRVLALTQLPDDLLALAGMERVSSLEHAARVLFERHGSGARIALAPRGGSLLYMTREQRGK
jgi:nickel-dependent lactate racemase